MLALPFTSADTIADDTVRDLLPLKPEVKAFLEAGADEELIEVATVHWPDTEAENNHYGWPIATVTGDTIVLMHRRIPGHNAKGAGDPSPEMSYGIVLRSTDGGKTWSEPYDLREAMRPEDRNRGGVVPLSHRFKFDPDNDSTQGYKVHLHAIGTTRDGAVVAINNHGVFRSEDAGRSWSHFPKALREDVFDHQLVNFGPRIIDHPEAGLLAFGNWFGAFDQPAARPQKSNDFVVLSSRDGGASWTPTAYDVGFPQYEPAALLPEDRLLFITRDQTNVRSHRQMSWSPGEVPTVIDTNLHDPRYVDTVDFSYNPVTERFEMVRSERHRMELWLWSMDPDDWESGQWRRECLLFGIEGSFYRDSDGFHPAAAVIDEQKGVQHIFIYAGHPNGPAGIFRITRTLDTDRLRRAWLTSAQTFQSIEGDELGHVYWTNVEEFTFNRADIANLPETWEALHMASGFNPGIAVDSVNGILYGADRSVSGIRGGATDGTGSLTKIVDNGGRRPGGIAVDTVNRRLYWADDLADGGIWTSTADGGNRIKLIGDTRAQDVEIDPHPASGYAAQKQIPIIGIDFNRTDVFGSPSQSFFRAVGGSSVQEENAASYSKPFGPRQVTITQPDGVKFEFRGGNGGASRAIPGGETSLSFLVADFIATRMGAIDLEIAGLAAGDYMFRSWHLDTLTAGNLGFAQGAATTTPNTIEARIGGDLMGSVQGTSLGSPGLDTTFISDSQIPRIEFEFGHDGSSSLILELRASEPNGPDNFLLLNGFAIYPKIP